MSKTTGPRFVALMAASKLWLKGNGRKWWVYDQGHGCYYNADGFMEINGKRYEAGTWREWLAAGTSPVPF